MRLFRLLASFATVVFLGAEASCVSTTKQTTKNVLSANTNLDTVKVEDYGFDVNADSPEQFKVSVQQSTCTPTSHSFSLKFMSSINTISTTLATYGGNLKGVYVASDDPNCPSDKDTKNLVKYDIDPDNLPKDFYTKEMVELDESGNPVLDEEGKYKFIPDSDGVTHGYAIDIPTYDGYVYRIDSSDKQEAVIIPNYISRQDRYRIHVTAIGTNVFNYRKQSNGSEKSTVKKLVKVVIGDNIKTFAENAFIGKQAEPKELTNVELCILGEQNAEGRTYGDNWSGDANVTFNYDLSTLTTLESDKQKITLTELNTLKKVYLNGEKTDADGNIMYFDSQGNRIDLEGNYLDEDGAIVEEKEPTTDIPRTKLAASVLNYTSSTAYSSKTIVFGDEQNKRPMVLQYDVKHKDESVETKYYEFKNDTDGEYFGVGTIAGLTDKTIYVDFHIDSGDVVDAESLVIRNLFEQKDKETTLKPDTSIEYSCIPEKAYSNTYSINEFVDTKFKSMKSFGKYTAFTLTVNKVDGIFEKVNPSSYKQYKSKIEAGKIKIRYLFNNFASSSYRVRFVKNGEIVTKEVSFNKSAKKGLTLTFHLLTKHDDNQVTFLLRNDLIDKDFNASTVRGLEYKAVTFKLDLMNTKKGTTQVVTKSEVNTRFGYLDILPFNAEATKSFNCSKLVIIVALSYVAIFTLCVVLYYFYAKEKYKNDEFKRMNTKKYCKKSLINFVSAAFVVLALIFIIIRFGLFNTSVIVYNPIDPFVIIFGIIAIVVAGIYLKRLIVFTKTEKERRRSIKLKLNEDVADDGTK